VTTRDDDINAQVEAMLAAQRSYKRRWAIYGFVVLLIGVGLIAGFAWFREFWFRPTPDIDEIQQNVFDLTNDPACRELLENVDALQTNWTTERQGLRDLFDSNDPDTLQAGRKQVRSYLEAYRVEIRRVLIIKGQWRHVQRDIESFLKHVVFYLEKMDAALEKKVISLAAAAAAPPDADAGADADTGPSDPIAEAVAAKKAGDPKANYERFWTHVTGDHDKWRIYRQGPIPCGKREGPVPELPDTPAEIKLDLGEPAAPLKGTGSVDDQGK
jgi:hypothetical protein